MSMVRSVPQDTASCAAAGVEAVAAMPAEKRATPIAAAMPPDFLNIFIPLYV
jgi:hypothetical protein